MSVPAVDFPDEPTVSPRRGPGSRGATVRALPLRAPAARPGGATAPGGTPAPGSATRPAAARPAQRARLVPSPRTPQRAARALVEAPEVEPLRARPVVRRAPVARPARDLPPVLPAVRETEELGEVTFVGRAPMSGRARGLVVEPSGAARGRAAAAPRLRLTRRARMLVAVALAAAIAGGAYLTQQASVDPLAQAPSSVVVQPGDTLYSIATRVAPDADPRDVVARIRVANDLTPSEVGALAPGDTLVIPTD